MPNSSIISKSKNKIIKEFIKNENIIAAIDSKKINPKQTEKYIGTHIFDYNQNPFTLTDVDTFITVQVQIPDTYFRSKPFVRPRIEIWIISHERHMKVDNIPKVMANRNDYLSMLIDEMLNDRSDFGIGRLHLVSNIEGVFNQDYAWRKMLFETEEFNESMCIDV